MPTVKCDLLVRYDEQEKRVCLYAVPSSRTETLRRYPYVGFIKSTEHFLSMAPDKAEQWVGRMVFAELDLHCNQKIGIRDYSALAHAERQEHIAELERKALEDDAEAQFELFHHFLNTAMKQKSQECLDRADSLLLMASSQGHAQALALLAAWPRLKSETAQRFAKP